MAAEFLGPLVLVAIVLVILDEIDPPNRKRYYGCGCLWYTRSGQRGRDFKCNDCREKLLDLVRKP